MNFQKISKEKILLKNIINSIKKLNSKKKSFYLHSPVINKKDKLSVLNCLSSTYISTYSHITKKFERNIRNYTKAKFSIATINATSAIHVSLKAVGVKKGDEVLVGDLNYIAAANTVLYLGAVPHFVDINLENLFIDTNKLEIYLKKNTYCKKNFFYNKKTGRKITAIIATYIFGKGGDISELLRLAKKYNLKVIEDASEALGSFYRKKHLGTFGDVGVISFNGNKIISTGGGGVILTKKKDIYNKCFKLCTIGRNTKHWQYDYSEIGYNYRLPGLNASLGISQLKKINSYIKKKKGIFNHYKKFFKTSDIKLFSNNKEFSDNNWLNAIFIKNSNLKLLKRLIVGANNKKIQIRPAWKLMHKIKYLNKFPKMRLVNSIIAEKSILTLPSGPDVFEK